MRRTLRSLWACSLAAIACSAGCSRATDLPRAVAASEPSSAAAPEVSNGPATSASPVEPVRYDRDVRPILADRCFRCHGPDEKARQGKLRLDLAASATADRGGYAAIVPGAPEASELWRRVTHADPDERMPPAKSNRRVLSEEERALVRRWIEEGARYEPHWSFVAPVRPSVPDVRDAGWCRNAIDRFVLARLEREGIAPSPAAEPETLVRRLFLDLTGLPPTPEESDAFLQDRAQDALGADRSPDAVEHLARRLLDEEPYRSRYAERMATPWLDAARYADTSGIHMDAGRQSWLWRDWVLAAFRDGMPFDRFLTEQLAGDLVVDATSEQKIASGFLRNHVTSDEGGAIDEEYKIEYAVDRAATTGSVFLGLTLGCARCHEHKFDPISQEEFYRFLAFFNSNEEPGVYSQSPDANRALEPFLEVPSAEEARALAELDERLTQERGELDVPVPGEAEERAAFFVELVERCGVRWEDSSVAGARSEQGATLAVEADGSVFASGENPDQDEHAITLRTDATGLELLALLALADPRLPEGRVGRGTNGNAVLTGVVARVRSLAEPERTEDVRFVWAWADREQEDGDFAVTNVLDERDERGWAVDGHQEPGDRTLLLLAERPFGFEGGSEVEVRLSYRSVYTQHAFGRVRLALGRLAPHGKTVLPVAASSWFTVGPFPADSGAAAFETAFGPETDPLDLARNFGFGNQYWRFGEGYRDGRANGGLPAGTNATYVAKRLYVPSARTVGVMLGSDDGARVFLDGRDVHSNQVERSLALDQDRLTLELPSGEHVLVFKVVNAGGDAGFAWRPERGAEELTGDLAAAFLPPALRSSALEMRLERGWRTVFSPGYRERAARIAALEEEQKTRAAAIPRAMVMQELAEPRATYLLERGLYDRPDLGKALERGVPAVLGALPADVSADRLALARWMAAPENPLVSRVAVNRLWELVFGAGLVRTSEDFGHQGEWPSHPELLDWLAVELVDSGWDVKHVLTLFVTSATYRQSAMLRPELAERDPENRLLARFARRRLGAEAIRDQALYVAGLLVERWGGPSVKPYQPEGLWQEVAMVQSNTREFVRGAGDDLWRRSLYTYWKRACPPPALSAFDAPTREFCSIRRGSTNTPLQALVLWNDEQFVEAARALASRTLGSKSAADDRARLAELHRRCTGRRPEERELETLAGALERFRARYAAAPEDAQLLLEVGEAPLPEGIEPAELAAWTLVASAVLSLDATITRG